MSTWENHYSYENLFSSCRLISHQSLTIVRSFDFIFIMKWRFRWRGRTYNCPNSKYTISTTTDGLPNGNCCRSSWSAATTTTATSNVCPRCWCSGVDTPPPCGSRCWIQPRRFILRRSGAGFSSSATTTIAVARNDAASATRSRRYAHASWHWRSTTFHGNISRKYRSFHPSSQTYPTTH